MRSPQVGGVRLRTAQNAQCVPIIIGRMQTAPRLIWRGNLVAGSGVSGKKFKGGKKGAGITTYTADADMLLGTMGFGRTRENQLTSQPLQSVLSIWSDKEKYPVQIGSSSGVVSGGAFTITVPGGGVLIEIFAVTVAEAYSQVVNDFGGPGSSTLTGTWQRPLWNSAFYFYDPSSQVPLAGSTRAPYTYSQAASVAASTTLSINAAQNGKTVTVYFAYVSGASKLPLTKAKQVFESLLGSTSTVAQPISYTDVGGIAAVKADLGATGAQPNNKYETLGWGGIGLDGDANPADVLALLVMSPHGLNASSLLQQTQATDSILGDLAAMRAYCDANGIWLSLYLDQQRSGSDLLGDIFDTANCAPVWSEGVLKAVPYSEISQVGNGAAFIAPTAAGPVVALTSVDFICEKGKVPITVTRTKQSDSKNILPVEFTDRSNDYATNSVDVMEGQSVSEFGARRDSTKTFHWIQSAAVANIVGSPIVKRSAIQEKTVLAFKLMPRFLRLEAMDLVSITEPTAGLSAYPARLTKADVQEDSSIDCEAVPYFYGANAPYGAASAQAGTPGTVYTNIEPTSVGTPYFFEPVPRAAGGDAELWIGVPSADPNNGGCEVLVSFDGGSTYQSLGRFNGKSTMGAVMTSTWAAGSDPDTTHDLAVDLTSSLGVLSSWPAASADAFVPLAVVEGGAGAVPYELIAFTTATLTAANKYSLKATGAGNEIRRSVYSAPTVGAGVAHTVGKKFVYLNDPVFRVPLDPKWIGQTLHFKFPAFNIFGSNEQAQSAATDYTYAVTGVAASLAGNGSYSISPANPLSQAASTYSVAMAQSTATFTPSGVQTNYNARTFSVADPGAGNSQQYWVTVYDPGQIGDTGAGTTLSAFCDANQTKWNTAGYIRIGTIVVTHPGVTSGGGGGSSSGSIGTLTVTDSGDHLNFTLSKPVSLLMLFRNGVFVDPADYTFSGSGFKLVRALATGENLNAVGA